MDQNAAAQLHQCGVIGLQDDFAIKNVA